MSWKQTEEENGYKKRSSATEETKGNGNQKNYFSELVESEARLGYE